MGSQDHFPRGQKSLQVISPSINGFGVRWHQFTDNERRHLPSGGFPHPIYHVSRLLTEGNVPFIILERKQNASNVCHLRESLKMTCWLPVNVGHYLNAIEILIHYFPKYNLSDTGRLFQNLSFCHLWGHISIKTLGTLDSHRSWLDIPIHNGVVTPGAQPAMKKQVSCWLWPYSLYCKAWRREGPSSAVPDGRLTEPRVCGVQHVTNVW